MKSKYNPDKHILEEQPEMKEPDATNSFVYVHQEYYDSAIQEYNEQKALCKTYDVTGEAPDDWLTGRELIPGVDYRIDVEYENFEPGNRATRIVAVPIEENKKVEEEKEETKQISNVDEAAEKRKVVCNWHGEKVVFYNPTDEQAVYLLLVGKAANNSVKGDERLPK